VITVVGAAPVGLVPVLGPLTRAMLGHSTPTSP
jgi:hypothetical protein